MRIKKPKKICLFIAVLALGWQGGVYAQDVPDSEAGQRQYASCIERSVGNWLGVVEPIIEYDDSVWQKTTTIEQYFSTARASVKVMILVSETAGAILQGFDPRNLGASQEGDRAFADGIVANIDENGIGTRVGPVGINWKVVLGEVSADEFWELASFSVDRQCIDAITNGEMD